MILVEGLINLKFVLFKYRVYLGCILLVGQKIVRVGFVLIADLLEATVLVRQTFTLMRHSLHILHIGTIIAKFFYQRRRKSVEFFLHFSFSFSLCLLHLMVVVLDHFKK